MDEQVERRRSLQQRGFVLTGTSSVTAALALSSLSFVFQQNAALVGFARVSAVAAMLCFAGSAVLALFAVREGGPASATVAALTTSNDADTGKVMGGAVLEVIGICLLAVTALLFFA